MGKAAMIDASARATCETVDALPPAVRPLVHEFGFAVVMAFNNAGILDPKVVRRLVHAVWLGPREPGQIPARRLQHQRTYSTLDAMLSPGHVRSTTTLLPLLDTCNLVLAPASGPTVKMVEASVAAVRSYGILSKEKKHRVRLEAALHAARDEMRAAIRAGADA
jgi:hypothetical protein